MRNEFVVRGVPTAPDDVLVEIVDGVYLPLVRQRGRLPGPVDVRAVINANDVDGPFGLINAVDHSVCAAACGVIAAQLAGERLADPLRVVEQRPGQELSDRCRNRERQATRWPRNEHTASRRRQR
jgi:hypothetical protein